MEPTNGQTAPFSIDEVDWNELSQFGILRDELEADGHLEPLLRGEQTEVVSLGLVLMGADVVVDATLQLVRRNGAPLLEIVGVKPPINNQSKNKTNR